MAASKVDALQAQVKAAVAKEVSDYGDRNAHIVDGKKVKPKPPRLWFENKVSTLVSLAKVQEAFVEDLIG